MQGRFKITATADKINTHRSKEMAMKNSIIIQNCQRVHKHSLRMDIENIELIRATNVLDTGY